MTDEISKMLTLSTAHVTKETADAINDGFDLVTFNKDEYGWFLHVATCHAKDLPSDLTAVVDYTKALGCEWLCLDRDGDVNPNLPTWEW